VDDGSLVGLLEGTDDGCRDGCWDTVGLSDGSKLGAVLMEGTTDGV
jgi:hypothetical protein